MRAATFDWLNTVDDLEINGSVLRFTLSSSNNYNELEQITAEVQLGTKTVEAYDSANPENGFDIEVPQVKTRICTVYDMDNVHAIEGQPFELTADQHRFLNEYLDEILEN
jgi:hypothetical protein